MANESTRTVRTVQVTFLSECLRADPNLIRDHRMQVEYEIRPTVLHNWAQRGPYADD